MHALSICKNIRRREHRRVYAPQLHTPEMLRLGLAQQHNPRPAAILADHLQYGISARFSLLRQQDIANPRHLPARAFTSDTLPASNANSERSAGTAMKKYVVSPPASIRDNNCAVL